MRWNSSNGRRGILVGRAFSLLSGIGRTLGHRENVLAAMGVG